MGRSRGGPQPPAAGTSGHCALPAPRGFPCPLPARLCAPRAAQSAHSSAFYFIILAWNLGNFFFFFFLQKLSVYLRSKRRVISPPPLVFCSRHGLYGSLHPFGAAPSACLASRWLKCLEEVPLVCVDSGVRGTALLPEGCLHVPGAISVYWKAGHLLEDLGRRDCSSSRLQSTYRAQALRAPG